MKRQKLLHRLAMLLNAEERKKHRHLEELRKVLAKLKQKQRRLKEEMEAEKVGRKKKRLEKEYEIVRAQRAKGLDSLRSLEKDTRPHNTEMI